MDYEKKYKEALELARVAAFNGHQSLMEGIFPELAESEDEKIRKELIDIVAKSPITFAFEDKNKVLSWLEKQDTERKQLYVRFGDIPSNEKSKIYHGEEEIGDENGVSVYPAFELNGNIVLGLTLPITKTTLYTQQHLLEYDNRPCYLVSGDYVGKGTDGEPLIKNISVIKRLDNYRIKECEKKPAIEMKSAEESLGIDSETYNKIVDECIYGEQKPQRMVSAEAKEALYDKPACAWSEEDEHRIKLLEALCEDKMFESVPNSTMYEEMKITIDWLKSLKDRVQPKQEWSEEDEKILNKISDWWNNHYTGVKKDYTFEGYSGHYLDNSTIVNLAQYFYELGMAESNKSQKGE